MKALILIAAVLGCVQGRAEMPAAYETLGDVLPFDDFGAYDNASALEVLVKERKAAVVVELGCWLGKSTRHIARTLPEKGVVYAVGKWTGGKTLEENRDHYVQQPYEQFLSNTLHANLADKIIPLRAATALAVKKIQQLRIKPDLIYVDSSHDEQTVYEDLKAVYPLVKGSGVVCGSDWMWMEKNGFSVRNAVVRFASENRLHIKIYNGDLWLLEESRKSEVGSQK